MKLEDGARPVHSKKSDWPSDLVIVRHGESRLNADKRHAVAAGLLKYGGGIRHPDTPLTDLGREQAAQVGSYLTGFEFHRVITSPYLRAIQTTEEIVKAFSYKAEVRVDERIREREFGIIDGLTRPGILQKYPDELERADREGKYYYRPPGGESYPDVNLRVHSFLTSMRQNFAGRPLLIICHSIVIWAFRKTLDRLSEKELLELHQDPDSKIANCCICRYSLDDSTGRLQLKAFNEVHYTPKSPVSDLPNLQR